MRPIDEMTAERAAEACAGLHYTSAEFKAASAAVDWEGLWPEVNRDGILTGRTVGDEDGYLNVADEVMIPVAEAVAGGWRIDREEGRSQPPSPAMVEVEVEVRHAASIPGARWCRPLGWSPRNRVEGADWCDGDAAWLSEESEEAGIVVFGLHAAAEGDRATVKVSDLRVASSGDCRVIGEVEVDFA